MPRFSRSRSMPNLKSESFCGEFTTSFLLAQQEISSQTFPSLFLKKSIHQNSHLRNGTRRRLSINEKDQCSTNVFLSYSASGSGHQKKEVFDRSETESSFSKKMHIRLSSTELKDSNDTKSGSSSSQNSLRERAVVVGAGLSGLTITYFLKKHGINPLVFESSSRTGGRIYALKSGINTPPRTETPSNSIAENSDSEPSQIKENNKNCYNSFEEKENIVSKIDIGFRTIHPEYSNTAELISSLGLEVSAISSGVTLIQSGKFSPVTIWKSSVAKKQLLAPSGGMNLFVDRLSKDINIRIEHKLELLSFNAGHWHLEFQKLGTKEKVYVSTKLLFIAIPPRKFADVTFGNQIVPNALLFLLKQTPTQYIDNVWFVAHYNEEFWSPVHLNYVPVAYCPQGPLLEVYTSALSKYGPFSIVGRIHPTYTTQISSSGKHGTKNGVTNQSDMKEEITNHLARLFGPKAKTPQKVTIIDFRRNKDLCSGEDWTDFHCSTAENGTEVSPLTKDDRIDLFNSIQYFSETLARRGLFLAFPDVHPIDPGSAEQAVVAAKKAIQHASILNLLS